jgi:hypothetical protein
LGAKRAAGSDDGRAMVVKAARIAQPESVVDRGSSPWSQRLMTLSALRASFDPYSAACAPAPGCRSRPRAAVPADGCFPTEAVTRQASDIISSPIEPWRVRHGSEACVRGKRLEPKTGSVGRRTGCQLRLGGVQLSCCSERQKSLGVISGSPKLQRETGLEREICPLVTVMQSQGPIAKPRPNLGFSARNG